MGMYLNGNLIGRGSADEYANIQQLETFSFQSTLNSQKGDQIWLRIYESSRAGASLAASWFTHVSGFLLEENMYQSFKDM